MSITAGSPPALSPALSPALTPASEHRLRALAERWAHAGAAERANYQLYLIELAEALGVERPRPAAAAAAAHADGAAEGAFQFEYAVKATTRDGTVTTNFIDLYKAGCFALEAKAVEEGAPSVRTLTGAFGQVANYARDLAERPPYILVLDVGRTLLVWDRWAGSYGGFHAGRRVELRTLAERPDDVALLRDLWTDPSRRDPRQHAQAVTEEIAALLAELAATLERRGHDQERVARFLIRCVFTMFAEDVHLLPDQSFRRLLDAVQPTGAGGFVAAAEALWRAMDEGTLFGYHKLLRFNGHFFRDAGALPLEAAELALLRRAAAADWSAVEPTIFGTLLVRALTPEERHRLGAEYTPRAFIERLVRPTVEEPVRERWAAVQAEVLQLRERGRARDVQLAEARLLDFHGWLRGLRILDPACGSGNFLYVTMHALKRVEVELFRLHAELAGGQAGLRLDDVRPEQFYGLEVKAWAREIAELTLWIGYHQFWRLHNDVQPPEPVLRDTGTLEHRDAVLAWDAIRHDPSRDRPDPTPRLVHPVTGQMVPDPEATLPYVEYVNPRAAAWPEADFIVGNPPYLGGTEMRETLGSGYVNALRATYPELPDGVDFVLFWWHRAALAVKSGRTARAGLITTNSITQIRNRAIVQRAAEDGVRVMWAIADHPWADEAAGAAVRVAMTVVAHDPPSATLLKVDDDAVEIASIVVSSLNADLSTHADVATASATPLRANDGLCFFGFLINGAGFLLEPDEYRQLIHLDAKNADVIKPIVGGRDIAGRPSECYVIDFAGRSVEEAREYPTAYNIVLDRVKPRRDANRDRGIRENWWRFHRIRQELRRAIVALPRFIVTVETMKHRVFTFMQAGTAPDHSLVCIAMDSEFHLGVLSSQIHVTWATAAGGRLGVGNDSRYNRTVCFDPFPFPVSPTQIDERIAAKARALDTHRSSAIARDERVTMTGMYNVIDKLRANAPLTPKERTIHELAACGVLRDLHDELDVLVAEAYGWPWPLPREEILDRLVALHDERVAEERSGLVRWLRPEFQDPGAAAATATAPGAPPPRAGGAVAADGGDDDREPEPWPATAVEQIRALAALVARRPATTDQATAHFAGARREIVVRHLETLALLGELRELGPGHYAAAGVD